MSKSKIKKGDDVIVISGDFSGLSDDKRTGKVKLIDRKKNRIVVEGINIRKIAVKRDASNPQGGIVENECPIHISNVMLKERYFNKPNRKSK